MGHHAFTQHLRSRFLPKRHKPTNHLRKPRLTQHTPYPPIITPFRQVRFEHNRFQLLSHQCRVLLDKITQTPFTIRHQCIECQMVFALEVFDGVRRHRHRRFCRRCGVGLGRIPFWQEILRSSGHNPVDDAEMAPVGGFVDSQTVHHRGVRFNDHVAGRSFQFVVDDRRNDPVSSSQFKDRTLGCNTIVADVLLFPFIVQCDGLVVFVDVRYAVQLREFEMGGALGVGDGSLFPVGPYGAGFGGVGSRGFAGFAGAAWGVTVAATSGIPLARLGHWWMRRQERR